MSTTRLSTTKHNPLLPPPAKSVIATASEEHEHHNDNQKSCHSLLPIHIEDFHFCIWVRTDYVASHGIYLVESQTAIQTLGARPGATAIPRSFREFDVVRVIQTRTVPLHLARHDIPSQLNPFIDRNPINACGSE